MDPASRLHREIAPLRRLWRGIEHDLINLGIGRLAEMRGMDAAELARRYCAAARHPADPTLVDVFAALIHFAETGIPRSLPQIMRDNLHRVASVAGRTASATECRADAYRDSASTTRRAAAAMRATAAGSTAAG